MSEKVTKASPQPKSPPKEKSENSVPMKNGSEKLVGDPPVEVSNGKDVLLTENTNKRPKKTKRSRPVTPCTEKADIDTKSLKIEPAIKEKDEKVENEILNSSTEASKEIVVEETCKIPDEDKEKDSDEILNSHEQKNNEDGNTNEDVLLDSDSYMDPLVLHADEPCPELEFEENSDKDSGQCSPIISRCVTRRSQNRNIPTPKTPKSVDDQESDRATPTFTPDLEVPKHPTLRDLNDTDNSNMDNLSTKVQVDSDATRSDLSEGESDFLINLKMKDKNAISRCLSSRRSIKPLSDEIRKKSFRNSMQRANLSIPFFSSSRDSVERAPSVKRKSRSETPEDRKRAKLDSPGLLTKITSPFSSLRSKFGGAPNSTSTPKLTSYRDQKNDLGGDFIDQMGVPGTMEPEKKWCSIM